MDDVSLPPEFKRFAAEAVASGRYRSTADVVRAGLVLLRQAEAELADFIESLEQARLEGERDGFLTPDQVAKRIQAVIAEIALRPE